MDKKQYQQLAGEFIDMWQKQLETVITDKQFVEQMFAGLQQMTNYATPDSHEQAAPTPPDAISEQLSQLDFRLRMVEQRLEKLESKPAKPRAKKPSGKPAKSGAGRSAKKAPAAKKGS